jgi:hypothetical protein
MTASVLSIKAALGACSGHSGLLTPSEVSLVPYSGISFKGSQTAIFAWAEASSEQPQPDDGDPVAQAEHRVRVSSRGLDCGRPKRGIGLGIVELL